MKLFPKQWKNSKIQYLKKIHIEKNTTLERNLQKFREIPTYKHSSSTRTTIQTINNSKMFHFHIYRILFDL